MLIGFGRSIVQKFLDADAGAGATASVSSEPDVRVVSADSGDTDAGADDDAESQADEDPGAAGEESGEVGEAGEVPGAAQAKSIFAQLHDEEFGDHEPKQDELPEGIKPESRAAKAIVDLRSRAQRAESEVGNLQQVMQQQENQVGQYLQQMQTQVQQLREENAAMRARQEVLQQRTAPTKEENPYVADLMERFDKDVLTTKLNPFETRMKALEDENRQFKAQQKKAVEEAGINARAKELRSEAQKLFSDVVMRGIPGEKAQELAPLGTAMTLAMLRATPGQSMQQAAANLRRFILQSADTLSRHATAPKAAALKAKADAPPVSTRGGVGGKVKEALPDQNSLVANGYSNPMDWIDAGRPKLTRKLNG